MSRGTRAGDSDTSKGSGGVAALVGRVAVLYQVVETVIRRVAVPVREYRRWYG